MFILDGLYKIFRWGLGGLFIYAGILKLLDPRVFAVLIDAYGIVPDFLLPPVSLALPTLEIIAGTGLLFDIRGSLSLTAGLMILFISVLGYGIWMGLDIDCGCFGPGDPEGEAFHGLRAALCRDFFILAGISFLYSWRRYRNIAPVHPALFNINPFKEGRNEDAHV